MKLIIKGMYFVLTYDNINTILINFIINKITNLLDFDTFCCSILNTVKIKLNNH